MAAFTQAQLDALIAAIASGATKVEYADKTIEYRSLAEMRSLKNEMEICLGLAKKKGGRRVAIFSSGHHS